MKLYTINTGYFKLDGVAMFGVVPKSIWNKLNPADENNMCSWALRCLLIEDEGRRILIDNGMGNKQDEKFFGHYYLHGDDSLDKSLAAHGFIRDDITDVFLTHLHSDHTLGLPDLTLSFPRAIVVSGGSGDVTRSVVVPIRTAAELRAPTAGAVMTADGERLVVMPAEEPATPR